MSTTQVGNLKLRVCSNRESSAFQYGRMGVHLVAVPLSFAFSSSPHPFHTTSTPISTSTPFQTANIFPNHLSKNHEARLSLLPYMLALALVASLAAADSLNKSEHKQRWKSGGFSLLPANPHRSALLRSCFQDHSMHPLFHLPSGHACTAFF